jgi:hypothetical protein
MNDDPDDLMMMIMMELMEYANPREVRGVDWGFCSGVRVGKDKCLGR